MPSLLKHSLPYFIVTAVACLAASYAQEAVTSASLAASAARSLPLALGDARDFVGLLWAAAAVPPVLGLWSYYRARSLSVYSLAAVGCLVAFLMIQTVGAVGFESDRLISLLSKRA